MPIATTDSEIEHAADELVNNMIHSMPYDAQNTDDERMATHYALQTLASKVNSRLTKLNDRVKEGVKDGTIPVNSHTKNYMMTCTIGTPRRMFSKDAFVNAIAIRFPSIPKHQLKEIADSDECFNTSAAPISIKFEFEGAQ